MDTVMQVLHITTAIFLIGPLAVLPHLVPRLLRGRHTAAAASVGRVTTVFAWLSILVALFGFAVMGMGTGPSRPSFADTWIWLSIVLYVLALLLMLVLVTPAIRRQSRGAEDGAATLHVGSIMAPASIATIFLIAVAVLMVWKP